jgi:uncharacterized cupredoxin-like copper-binding protein
MIGNIRFLVATAALAAVSSVAACSSSGGTAADTDTPGQHSAPAKQSAQATNSTPNMLSITARDSAASMSYEISGSPHPGLVSIRFTNAGKYAHEVGVSMLKPGATPDQVKTALLAKNGERKAQALLLNPDAEYPVPSILGPGGSEVDVANLAAGHYVVLCFLPGPNGMPHVAMGMIGGFTVAGSKSTQQPPQADGTVELSDHGITVPSGFGTGGTYQVTNTGTKPHDFSLAKLAGKPLPALFQCVEGAFGKGTPIDDCPGTLAGGVNTLKPGESAYLTLTLPAGDYGYVSTEGEGADLRAGLVGTFSVK